VCKNLVGLAFVLAGVAMLVLPGQGILTIVIGLSLMNFPGKHVLERYIVQQPSILRAINWMRHRAGQPPLKVPQSDTTVEDTQKHA
jgi:putative transmembrane protein PGPGW